MNTTFPPLRRAVATAALALSALVLCAVPAAAVAAAAVTYTHEEAPAYEHQLAANEIAQARINKFVRHLDLTLKNGQHFVYVYPKKTEPTVYAALIAHHIPVEVLTPTAAKSEAAKPVHHKIRYIVGGVVIAIAIIVVAVLLIDRRRKAIAE